MALSDSFLQELKMKTDIEDVISTYVTLKRRGATLVGLCPFHNEKTPSFTVYPATQSFYCFGCGAGGDAITFLKKIENLDYLDAVKTLAQRAGLQMPQEGFDDSLSKRRRRILEMNREAARFYHSVLLSPEGKVGYDYYIGRALSAATINHFGLGFAPNQWDALLKHMRAKGYQPAELVDAGLARKGQKGYYDNFRNRVMTPIIDVRGNVIAFGGRVLDDSKPKYINTGDTLVYKKTNELFALNFAKDSKEDALILCEGYMDVIALHQAGFTNAVASLGTALTSGHASLVKRYTKEVLLLYDSDGAGVEATKKVIAILREVGVGARVINMRPYKDPDEFIQNLGSEAFEERIKKAESGMMFLARIYSEEYDQSDPGELTKFQNQIARELAYIEDDLERNNYVDAIARKYVIDKDALAAKVHAYGVAGTAKPEIVERETRRLQEQQGYEEFPGDQSAGAPGRPETKDNKTAKLLLTWLVNRPELFARLDGVVSEADFEPGIYRTVADKLYSQYREKHKVEPAVVVNTFQDVEEQRLVAGMLQTDLAIDMTEEEIGNAITEVVKKIKLASIKKQLESENDMMKVQQLIKDRKKIEKFKVIL